MLERKRERSTSGLDWDCFWDVSSLPFSKVTAPNAPYCPFITGLSIEEEEEEEEIAGGATKQRSNKLTEEEEESPSTTADDEEEEEEEEEKALSTRTPLLLRASFLPATGGK